MSQGASGAKENGAGGWEGVAQIAAEAPGVPPEGVELQIGDSALPRAFVAGASSGTVSWGWAICNAASALRTRLHEEDGWVRPARRASPGPTIQPKPPPPPIPPTHTSPPFPPPPRQHHSC